MSQWLKRIAVILGITLIACAGTLLLSLPGTRRADDFFYDTFYRRRPIQDMQNSQVVLVVADDESLRLAKKPWPWPRAYWGELSTYLEKAGAKAIAFDIIFPEPSLYGDDDAFAEAMNGVKIPVIYGREVENGDWRPFAPEKIETENFAAINLGNDKVYRTYPPEKDGQPSLAALTVVNAGMPPREFVEAFPGPFLLHYYGPHKDATGRQTFRFIRAYDVLQASRNPEGLEARQLADAFKGKIVLIGAIALAAFDLKVSPLSDEYPGPEIQATAMENMLRKQWVHPAPRWSLFLVMAFCALAVSAGIVMPRHAAIKIAVPVLVTAALFGVGIQLFRGETIRWLSPTLPLAAIVISTPLAFGYTYFAEDRQRRFMLKALSKVVSPAVAAQLAESPERLQLGTVRSEVTVLFTDLANFTDLAEGMDVQSLGTFVNRYLGEMSAQVFVQDGTLDKYIGDAVMCFWNAPVPQKDHALRACRAALNMIERERALQAELGASLGNRRVFTRIGIHTATVAVGFIGSEHLYNYTVMGDGVNLASRMEGANKLYGSRILISEPAAMAVGEHFHLRRIDILRVKGKKQPMAIYELVAEKNASNAADAQPRCEGYDRAFALYLERRWDESEKMLLELSERFAQDVVFAALLARVRHYRQTPPPEAWDGVYVSESK